MNAINRCVSAPVMLVVLIAGLAGCEPPPLPNGNPDLIPASNQRVAFQSQCAQNVTVCTTSWPTAIATVVESDGQTVTEVSSNSFLVEATGGSDGVQVQFRGSETKMGETSTMLVFRWSFGAIDDDPCTMAPGTEVSTEVNPKLLLAPGFHYIRLFVINNVIRDVVSSQECGIIAEDTGSFDFVELEVEVRSY